MDIRVEAQGVDGTPRLVMELEVADGHWKPTDMQSEIARLFESFYDVSPNGISVVIDAPRRRFAHFTKAERDVLHDGLRQEASIDPSEDPSFPAIQATAQALLGELLEEESR